MNTATKELMKNILLGPNDPVMKAIELIDRGELRAAIVVDDEQKVLGVITDGDIRKGILSGVSTNAPVKNVMNKNFHHAQVSDSRAKILSILNHHKLLHIPILDENNRLVRLELLRNFIFAPKKENWVVLMCGGQGQRLMPLTETIPKPMLKVGERPILETILENFIEYNFSNFYFAVNYKSEMIKEHFGDGKKWGVNIQYLEEKKPLGTAGSLGLLEDNANSLPNSPVLVMNGDILTKINFDHLLGFHQEQEAMATMCIRELSYQVPYGVVNFSGSKMKKISEKPIEHYFVNAGVYVLEANALSLIQKNQVLSMTELFHLMLQQKKDVHVFPIREYWIDIGRHEDFNKANSDYPELFPIGS